jgi:hypothetical protein
MPSCGRCVRLLLVAALLTGCLGGGRGTTAGEDSAGTAPLFGLDAPRVDSLVFEEGCTEYTAYFVAGGLDREAVEPIRRIIFESSVVRTDFDRCADDAAAARHRAELLDSVRSLRWLGGEPWRSMRTLFLAWAGQQIERAFIVSCSERDPSMLYACSETDSVLVRCADILTGDPHHLTEEVRRLWRESPYATWERIERVTSGPDSLARARDRLFQLMSNHLNRKIHSRLSEDGTVDFNVYNRDFLELFDSVKIESWEP